MPSSRAKLNCKVVKPKQAAPSAVPEQKCSPDSEAAIQQFEIEVCWCIHKIEDSLISQRLTPRQRQEAEKTLKILKSSTQNLIKKRQIMRAYFGDYRAKMAEEESKMKLVAHRIKFAEAGNINAKSHFLKKSILASSGAEFKFNFPVEELHQLNITDNKTIEKCTTNYDNSKNVNNVDLYKDLNFVPSGNTFRFNFTIENDQ